MLQKTNHLVQLVLVVLVSRQVLVLLVHQVNLDFLAYQVFRLDQVLLANPVVLADQCHLVVLVDPEALLDQLVPVSLFLRENLRFQVYRVTL